MTTPRKATLGVLGTGALVAAALSLFPGTIKDVTLLAHDGVHYVTTEDTGPVTATRTQAFSWEALDFEPSGDGWFYLKTWRGTYWSAQPDGALHTDRTWTREWERFRPVAGDGGTCLQTWHGMFVVAELGGGGEVRANRLACGPWETFKTSKPLTGGTQPGPGPPPQSLGAMSVEDNFRYFSVNSERYDWREITDFALQARMLRGEAESHVRPKIREDWALRFGQTRVILTLDGAYWTDVNLHNGAARAIGYSLRSAPDMPDFWPHLHTLVRMHAEEGMRVRLVILGALEPFGGVWDPIARRDIFTGEVERKATEFSREVARQMAGYDHVMLEVANEPAAIGMRNSAAKLGALVCELKAIAPRLMIHAGDIAGMENAHEMYRCADAIDEHGPRDTGLDGIEAAKRWGEVPSRDQQVRNMPAISGEPANACEPRRDGQGGGWSQVLPEPIAHYAYAAVMRVRQINPTFHYDGGLYSLSPKPETRACIEAFHAGLDAIPMQTGHRWRGHWGLSQGDYWSDRLWPVSARHPEGTDDPREVEAWVRGNRGAWRAFGLNEWSVLFPTAPGFDWAPHLEAPATRTTGMSNSRFEIGIFRRQ